MKLEKYIELIKENLENISQVPLEIQNDADFQEVFVSLIEQLVENDKSVTEMADHFNAMLSVFSDTQVASSFEVAMFATDSEMDNLNETKDMFSKLRKHNKEKMQRVMGSIISNSLKLFIELNF